ncbi:MAG: type II toxin-antitoxin system HicB family antitoxin [Chloroflexi bacterium]|nr:type II toxin-antitoxin system HicB family antitoxin [Chloroflexota bacterium]
MVTYTVVIEQADGGYSAYAPDVPGCVAAGDTMPEVEELMREALVLHIESLREHGEPVPEPRASTALVEV